MKIIDSNTKKIISTTGRYAPKCSCSEREAVIRRTGSCRQMRGCSMQAARRL